MRLSSAQLWFVGCGHVPSLSPCAHAPRSNAMKACAPPPLSPTTAESSWATVTLRGALLGTTEALSLFAGDQFPFFPLFPSPPSLPPHPLSSLILSPSLLFLLSIMSVLCLFCSFSVPRFFVSRLLQISYRLASLDVRWAYSAVVTHFARRSGTPTE